MIASKLLRRPDFQSPLLYKVYKYMLQVYLSHFYGGGGIAMMGLPLRMPSIGEFFKEEELRRMINLFIANRHLVFLDLMDRHDFSVLKKYYSHSSMKEWMSRVDVDNVSMMDYLLRMTVGPCFRKDKGLCFDYGELCIDDMNVASYQMSVLDSLFF